MIATIGAGLVALSVFAVANLATAELKPNEIAQSLAENQGGADPLTELAGGSDTATTDAPSTQRHRAGRDHRSGRRRGRRHVAS